VDNRQPFLLVLPVVAQVVLLAGREHPR
jgi:hypothetical protein